ncbi:MAG: Ppx/GppA phosphatase family protein [Candidatus Dormibacteria bacterium]
MSRTLRLAAIDVGSNTIHLLLAGCRPGAAPRQLFRRREFVQLGLDVAATGRVGPERLERAARTLSGQVAEARRKGALELAVGATQALRAAANGEEVAAVLAQRAGIPELVVLAPAEEAQLAFAGATMALPPGTSTLLIDIGGASTQVALGPAGGVCSDRSLGLGSGSIAALAAGDPPSSEEWRVMQRRVGELIPDLVPSPPHTIALGTGGTITNLPRLLGREKGSALRLRDVEEVIEAFRELPVSEIATRSGMDLERVRLCRGGALILAHLMDLLGLSSVRCSERGLRDGMVTGILLRGEDWWRPLARPAVGPEAARAAREALARP